MNNISNQDSKDCHAKNRFWGTIALAGILFLVSLYFAVSIIREAPTPAGYIAIAIFLLSAVASVIGAVLTLRHRQEHGVKLLFYFLLTFPIVAGALIQGRTATSSAVILVMSVLAILWLLPRSSWRLYSILTVGALTLAWIFEWLHPAWRVPLKAATVGPAAAIVLGLILVSAIVRESMNRNLRTKLVMAFLVVTIIPLAITSFITARSSQNVLTNDASEKLEAAASQLAGQIDLFIYQNLQVLRADGKYPDLVDYLTLPAYQRKGSLEEERVQEILSAISGQDPVFISSVAVLDIKGVDVADTYVTDIGVDKSDRSYFQETVKTGVPYASDIEFSATTDLPSFYLAAPVRDASGNMIGVIRIRFFASVLQKFIADQTGAAGKTSYAVLLDPNHIRLAHGTNSDRLFKSIVPLDPAVLKDLQDKHLMPAGTPEELSTNLPDYEARLNDLDRIPYFASDTDGDGALEQSAFATMTTKPWLVAFIQDESVFLAPANAQTTGNLLATVVVAVLVGIAGFFFSQTLAGPVVRLTQVAEAIAGGDINVQAKVETGDEIGALANTFNRMTQQLRDFIATLEERVAARTKDLATVAEVGTATATILQTDRLLQQVVDLTKERFNLYHSHIYLLDEKGENLVLASGAGEPGRVMVSEGRSIPISREQSLVARAARERKGVTVNDVTQAPDFLPNPLLPDTRSELAVPMIVGGNVIGVFDIQSEQVGRFTDADVNIQTTMAAQLATSIQNVRSFETTRAKADLETLVNAIGQKIQRTTTMEDTLQTAIREIGLALGASRVKVSVGQSNRDKVASNN